MSRSKNWFLILCLHVAYFRYLISLRRWKGLQGCQIFLGKTYQNGKKYTNGHKLHKIYQMAIKYTNNIHCNTLQNLPKLGFLVWKYSIWQSWRAFDRLTDFSKQVSLRLNFLTQRIKAETFKSLNVAFCSDPLLVHGSREEQRFVTAEAKAKSTDY
jgi:hypothetical protein